MNQRQASRMLTVANFIKGLPERQYDQLTWCDGAPDGLQNECGTAACALGWTAAIFPRSWEWLRPRPDCIDYRPRLRQSGRDVYVDAAEFFGITLKESDELFQPHFRRATEQAVMMENLVQKYGYDYAT